MGDLGNIIVKSEGRVKTTITDRHVELQGHNSVIDKAIVVRFIYNAIHSLYA